MHPLLLLTLISPWIVAPIVTVLRARHSRSLNEERAHPPDNPPLVSLVIPARNEARNIERCIRSALSSTYPRLTIVAVDDHSTDLTGDILRDLARDDVRLRVITPEPLPAGWFGKQWACAAGAAASTGEIIGFLDADTWQAPDLVTRMVNGMQSRAADLLTVGGAQELGTFWERVIQPQVFLTMLVRFGGTEIVNASHRKEDKIANGQCIFVRRDAYDALGGHGAVRDKVAEDLALAQLYFANGKRSFLVLGLEQLSTRMYTSLSELVQGWGKNFYAGGIDAMRFGAVGRFLYPLVLASPFLTTIAPPLLLLCGSLGLVSENVMIWAATVIALNVVLWAIAYRMLRLPLFYAVLYPLGGAVLLYIALGSIVRGRRVRWKDRDYMLTS